MKTKNFKKNAIIGLVIFLLMASALITLSPTAKAASGVVQIGGSPKTGVDGMPVLKPLPAGVTPQYTIETRAYLSFRPNPIGIGQNLLVNIWTSPGQYHCFYMCDNIVEIQKPDGTTETVGPWNTYLGDATGWFEYIVDQPGVWRFKYSQPGTYLPVGVYDDRPGLAPGVGGFTTSDGLYRLGASVLYTASETDWQNLTVTEDMVSSWPYEPLPNDYWTRPVNPMHRDWYPILGNYPFTGGQYWYSQRTLYASNYKYTAYVQAPNSCHVVWKRQGNNAGMIGGMAYTFSTSGSPGTPNIIYNGRCYQTITKPMLTLVNGTYRTLPVSVWECYDLRTGEVYWDLTDVTAPTMIEYNPPGSGEVPGAEAAVSYSASLIAISGGRLIKYNPYTGAVQSNVSIGVSSATYYMPQWCMSVQNLGNNVPVAQRYRLINWTTAGTSTNFTSRIAPRTDGLGYQGLWNITYEGTSVPSAVDWDAGIGGSASWATPPGPQWCIGVNITMFDLHTGKRLWTYLTNDTLTENVQSGSSFVVDRGKCAFGAHGRQWACWDARTGSKLWESEKTEYPWGAWWPYNTASMDLSEEQGAIVAVTYEGIYAIDWADGKILWHYSDENSVPFESPYDATPFFTGVQIADGKIFAYNGEHTASQPPSRDWKLYAINASTGECVWKILNPSVPGAMADGYLTASNNYDGYMYVYGKGKSATTITAPDIAVAKGASVVIKGTVLDLSPGQLNTPCVSKASMETQMEYIHYSLPVDGIWHNETITGVPVVLTAIAADGTVTDLGTTTTNGYYGDFGYAWTPPNEGQYRVIASFAGDESYGSSAASTTLSVGPAATSAPTQSPSTASQVDYMPTLTGILAAVVVAIIVSVIALAVVLRKHA